MATSPTQQTDEKSAPTSVGIQLAGSSSSSVPADGAGLLELAVSLRSTVPIDVSFVVKLNGTSLKVIPSFSTESGEDSQDAFGLLFNANGHHIIAMIAWQDLQTESPKAYAAVEAILRNGDRSLQEAATFPDDIRMKHPETRMLHFIDIPLLEGGPAKPALPAPPHVLSKIEESTAFLQGGAGSDENKVDEISWLIHLFGDLHQPMHCVDRFNELHPAGDRGGNSFKLRGKVKNLHSLWDSSVNILTPGKDEEAVATEIMTTYPRERLQEDLAVTEPEAWAYASFNLAKVHAYGELVEDETNPPTPSMAYLANAEKIGQKQAALAGYRLSERLKSIFG